ATVVADALEAHAALPVVLDTVMVAKGGARLLDEAAVAVIGERLLRRSTLVTANVPEAEVLTGLTMRTVEDLGRAARQIVDDGVPAALVKGGHIEGEAVDVFYDGRDLIELRAARIDTRHTHGTGCTLAAAIAAEIALGRPLLEAVERAKRYVTRAIENAPGTRSPCTSGTTGSAGSCGTASPSSRWRSGTWSGASGRCAPRARSSVRAPRSDAMWTRPRCGTATTRW